MEVAVVCSYIKEMGVSAHDVGQGTAARPTSCALRQSLDSQTKETFYANSCRHFYRAGGG